MISLEFEVRHYIIEEVMNRMKAERVKNIEKNQCHDSFWNET